MLESVLKRVLQAVFGDGGVVLSEMAPFNALYLPLTETANDLATTTVDHFPDENRAWYVSKVYISTTANTSASFKLTDGLLPMAKFPWTASLMGSSILSPLPMRGVT
ncbi:unnamed protein product, partial [marine sediment metagenome]